MSMKDRMHTGELYLPGDEEISAVHETGQTHPASSLII